MSSAAALSSAPVALAAASATAHIMPKFVRRPVHALSLNLHGYWRRLSRGQDSTLAGLCRFHPTTDARRGVMRGRDCNTAQMSSSACQIQMQEEISREDSMLRPPDELLGGGGAQQRARRLGESRRRRRWGAAAATAARERRHVRAGRYVAARGAMAVGGCDVGAVTAELGPAACIVIDTSGAAVGKVLRGGNKGALQRGK